MGRASPALPDRQAGTILLPVILLLLLLATAATAMTVQARASLREASTRRVRLELGFEAEAAIRAAGLALASATARRAAPPFGIDGTPQGCLFGAGRRLVLAVQDEGGRVDLNKAMPDLLRRILAGAGLSAPETGALAEAILDHRDGAAGASSPGRPPPRPTRGDGRAAEFATVDELDTLPGVHAGLYDRLQPLFTVANGSAGIDPAVAAPAVRAVIPPRELASPDLESLTTPSNHSDFTITATVEGAAGLQVRRMALLHLDPQAGPLGRFTAWEAPAVLGPMARVAPGVFCQRLAEALASD